MTCEYANATALEEPGAPHARRLLDATREVEVCRANATRVVRHYGVSVLVYAEELTKFSGAGGGDIEWLLAYLAELLAARLRNETWIDVEICDVTTIVVAAPTLAPTTRWPTTAEPSYAPTSSPSPEPTPAPTVDPTPEPTPTPTSFAGVFFILPSLCHHAP